MHINDEQDEENGMYGVYCHWLMTYKRKPERFGVGSERWAILMRYALGINAYQ